MLTLFNASSINTSTLPLTGEVGDFIFDWFSIHDLMNITLKKVDNNDLTDVDLSTYNLAYNDGGAISSRYYRGRQIRLSWSIKADTQEEFEAYIDTLKKGTSKTGWELKIWGRKTKATLTKLSLNRDNYHVNWSPIEMIFTTVEPFWTEWTTSVGYLGITWTRSEELTYEWTAPSSPIFYLVFGVWTAVTQVQLTFEWLNLTIANTFASGDVLVIDGVNKEVTKNGTEIDFTWVFPEFTVLSNPFTTSFTGTVLADETVIYDTNFL